VPASGGNPHQITTLPKNHSWLMTKNSKFKLEVCTLSPPVGELVRRVPAANDPTDFFRTLDANRIRKKDKHSGWQLIHWHAKAQSDVLMVNK